MLYYTNKHSSVHVRSISRISKKYASEERIQYTLLPSNFLTLNTKNEFVSIKFLKRLCYAFFCCRCNNFEPSTSVCYGGGSVHHFCISVRFYILPVVLRFIPPESKKGPMCQNLKNEKMILA